MKGKIMIVDDAAAPIADWLAAFSRIWDDPESYDEFARTARAYSKRAEVQPDAIIAKLQQILQELITTDSRVAA